jgi:hypothetical protein
MADCPGRVSCARGCTLKLNRTMQRKVLEVCAAIYPEQIDPMALLAACNVEDSEPFMANVAYLAEHGLVDCKVRRIINGPAALGVCMITARGLDFLADDGGLTAILGTRVVKQRWPRTFRQPVR